ncbi:unnamed protein product [Symbiodinium sp. CCMP2592]|nr:unnamed protein product [Symbiodinium sp. CCMP2592]
MVVVALVVQSALPFADGAAANGAALRALEDRYAKLVERYRGDLNDTRLLRATLEPRRMLRVHSSLLPDLSARLGVAWLDLEHKKWEVDASCSVLDASHGFVSSGRKAAAIAVQDSV